jgi:ABC-2 type transport system ATP-binding protein
MEPAIETENLTKKFGTLTAINKLNLTVKRNTVHGFLGPNGAGKSTTIKILVGLLKESEGTAKILGNEVGIDLPQNRLSVGYMPELPRFPKHLKGVELLDIYGRVYGMTGQQRREQIPALIDLVGLKGRENDLIGKYSKGMQQRIGIAQALLCNPELVILDEPSVGLDPVGMVEVRELVKAITRDGVTVFVSSHLLFEVEQICSQVTIINHGVAIASDTLQNVAHMVSKPTVLHMEVSNLSKAMVQAVRSLPFVTEVEENGKKLAVKLKTSDDIRPQVSQEISKLGGLIVSMNLEGQSLEDAFIQLISKKQEEKR